MTTYYVDSDNGSDANNGLGPDSADATNKPYATLNAFTEVARSPGDICKVRRGTTATIDDAGQLDFTSDGTYAAPIVIEADYDDLGWNGGPDFANSAQTFTPVFGSKVMTASATITGISVGDWVYNTTDGDDPREFSYEAAAVSGTTLTLFLPWKGSTGATKTLKVMPAAPIWGSTTTFAFSWVFDADNYWYAQGIEVQTSSAVSMFNMNNNKNFVTKDCIVKGTVNTELYRGGDGSAVTKLIKTRCLDYENAFDSAHSDFDSENCLFDGNNNGISVLQPPAGGTYEFRECEFKNNTGADFRSGSESYDVNVFLRNCILGSTTQFDVADNVTQDYNIWVEDFDGAPNKSIQIGSTSLSDTEYIQQSDTGTLRSGGGNISILITPSVYLGPSEASRYEIFTYSFFTTTDSKTYTVYFKSNATTDWTTNPTATELWLEFGAWGDATNDFRKITKSTGTVDFTTDTDFDQILQVTVAPAQAGMSYLSLYYGKPKESGKANKFFIDTKAVVT